LHLGGLRKVYEPGPLRVGLGPGEKIFWAPSKGGQAENLYTKLGRLLSVAE